MHGLPLGNVIMVSYKYFGDLMGLVMDGEDCSLR